jgi:micrococcal nuclease
VLGTIIPAGTQLKLTYDQDQLGRTAAQAVTLDGRLVNAEIVRAGLATVVNDAPATPVPPALDAAAHEALDNKRGMHAADIACTVPGQVKAITDQVAKVPTAPPPGADVAALVAAANSATDARMAAEELDSKFTQNRQEAAWLVLDATERSQLQAQVETARDHAAAAETVLRDATNITVNQDATQAATQKEAARIAKALASIRKAEAQRAAEAARREQAARKAQAYAAAEAQALADAQHKSHSRQGQSSSSNNSSSDRSNSSGGSGKKKETKNGDSSGS